MESRYINLKTEVFSYSLILPIEYGSPGDAEVIIGSPGEFIPKRTYCIQTITLKNVPF